MFNRKSLFSFSCIRPMKHNFIISAYSAWMRFLDKTYENKAIVIISITMLSIRLNEVTVVLSKCHPVISWISYFPCSLDTCFQIYCVRDFGNWESHQREPKLGHNLAGQWRRFTKMILHEKICSDIVLQGKSIVIGVVDIAIQFSITSLLFFS